MSFSSNKVKPNNISIDGSQTVSNKVLDASNDFSGDIIDPARSDVKKGTQAELETYALSATNGQLCFATDTKLMYQVLDSALVSVGSGSAAINYIVNPDLNIDESDITGDTNLVISHETVAPLRGAGSLKISKGAIDASTQSVLIDMNPVDTADLAKKLTISFDIDASNINYKDGDAQVRIIKDPAGTPETIRVNGEDIKGGKNTHIAQFQTDHTEVDYALEIYWADTGVLATELILDNIQVGPREVVKGAAMTDWKSYVPVTQGIGTPVIDHCQYRRVGDSVEISARLTTGTSTAVEFQFGLPNNLKVDSSIGAITTVGTIEASNGNDYIHTILITGGDSYINVGLRLTGVDSTYVPQTGSGQYGTGKLLSFTASVPIQGWSANAVSSEDLGGREIVVEASSNGGTSITANVTNIDFTETRDTTGSFDGTTFIAPETGDYIISGQVYSTASNASNLLSYIDTVRDKDVMVSTVNTRYKPFSTTFRLNKGQTFSIRGDAAFTLQTSSTAHHISIVKLASPQTILETETVAASYTSNSGAVVANGANIIYEDIDFDTHGAYNVSTGDYTTAVSGYYTITASCYVTVDNAQLSINIDGVEKSDGYTVDRDIAKTSYIGYIEKGKVVSIKNTLGVARTLVAVGKYSSFSIARIK